MDTKIPFIGGSGELIDRRIKLAGHKKNDVFISNAVHCRPPGKRQSHTQIRSDLDVGDQSLPHRIAQSVAEFFDDLGVA
ncbi:uracil-DNA glycosylase family protein [Mycobacterium sp. MMS18-G62]